jgi:hypothetical protein
MRPGKSCGRHPYRSSVEIMGKAGWLSTPGGRSRCLVRESARLSTDLPQVSLRQGELLATRISEPQHMTLPHIHASYYGYVFIS